MANEVTKEELKAMIEVQSKNVEQLTVIANHLSTIVERENKIYERLYNGLSKEISGAIIVMIEKLKEEVEETKKGQTTQCAAATTTLKTTFAEELSNSSIAKDIGHVKWFIGIVGVVIIVATVILNGIGRKNEGYDLLKQIKYELSHTIEPQSQDLTDHMTKAHEVIQ